MIAVVGSVNRDQVLHVDHHPVPGETVIALGHETMPGGKGGNQAVAAARLGGDVAFVGGVGADDAGIALVEEFQKESVDTTNLVVDADGPTGLAVIILDAGGENSIVVSSGVNGKLSPDDVSHAEAVLMAATVTLLQLELPIETSTAAARASEGVVVLNAAPTTDLPAALLDAVDVLVVNRVELEALTGSTDPVSARGIGVPVTIVTLGAEGARLIRAESDETFPAPRVDVVDTTGAGDTFCGALAAGLDEGRSLEESVKRAVVAGALSVRAVGARSGMPTKAEVDAALPTLPT